MSDASESKVRESVQQVPPDPNLAMQTLEEMNAAHWTLGTPNDAALNHDQYLAEPCLEPRAQR